MQKMMVCTLKNPFFQHFLALVIQRQILDNLSFLIEIKYIIFNVKQKIELSDIKLIFVFGLFYFGPVFNFSARKRNIFMTFNKFVFSSIHLYMML